MILTTQAEVERYFTTRVGVGICVPIVLAPTERIDLSEWIAPHECCSMCGAATPGLRRDPEGSPREDCAACGDSGFLITTWGTAQTERWEEDQAGGVEQPEDDEGPAAGPIFLCGGIWRFRRSIERQAHRAMVKLFRENDRPGGGSLRRAYEMLPPAALAKLGRAA